MSQRRERHKALVYHSKPNPGKIKVVPTKSHQSQRDLSLAYSPGVAYPCLEINKTLMMFINTHPNQIWLL